MDKFRINFHLKFIKDLTKHRQLRWWAFQYKTSNLPEDHQPNLTNWATTSLLKGTCPITFQWDTSPLQSLWTVITWVLITPLTFTKTKHRTAKSNLNLAIFIKIKTKTHLALCRGVKGSTLGVISMMLQDLVVLHRREASIKRLFSVVEAIITLIKWTQLSSYRSKRAHLIWLYLNIAIKPQSTC